MRLEHERGGAGRDDDGLGVVGQHGRAADDLADVEVAEPVDGGVDAAAALLEVDARVRVLLAGGHVPAAHGAELLVDRLLAVAEAPGDAAHAHVVDDDVPVVEREAELVAVVPHKGRAKVPVALAVAVAVAVGAVGLDDHEGRLGAAVAHVEVLLKDHLGVVEALVAQGVARPGAEAVHLAAQAGEHVGVVAPDGRVGLLALVDHVGQGHAVGREHGRVAAVDEDLADAERPGDGDGVLAAGAAEGGQAVPGRVVALGLGDAADGARHGLVGDGQEAVGDLVDGHAAARLAVDLVGQLLQHAAAGVDVEGLVLALAKDLGEEVGQQAAEEQVGVGHGGRAALAVAGRARVGAGRLGADGEQAVAEEEARAAAGGDRVDVELGRLDGDAGRGGLEGVVEAAVAVARHVGAGAAHVEADDGDARAVVVRRDGVADDAAGGARQDGAQAGEAVDVDQAAVALHELAARAGGGGSAPAAEAAAEAALEGRDVAAQDGGQVGVGADRRGARHELDHGHELVAERDVGEAELAGHVADERLVVGEGVGVHEADGDAADAGVAHALQLAAHGVAVRAAQDAHRLARQAHDEVGGAGGGRAGARVDARQAALGVLGVVLERDALVDLDDGRVEHVGLADGQVEDARARLVADDEAVGEAARDHERDGLALALQQRVGGHRGAHADRVDERRVERLVARHVAAQKVRQDAPDALERRVAVVGRVLGQQLDDHVLAPVAAHAVGEGAAAVDGDADAARSGRVAGGHLGQSGAGMYIDRHGMSGAGLWTSSNSYESRSCLYRITRSAAALGLWSWRGGREGREGKKG